SFPISSNIPDYPSLAVSSDKVVITGNAYSCLLNTDTFVFVTLDCSKLAKPDVFLGGEYYIINKSDLLAHVDPPASRFFGPGSDLAGLTAVRPSSPTSTLY